MCCCVVMSAHRHAACRHGFDTCTLLLDAQSVACRCQCSGNATQGASSAPTWPVGTTTQWCSRMLGASWWRATTPTASAGCPTQTPLAAASSRCCCVWRWCWCFLLASHAKGCPAVRIAGLIAGWLVPGPTAGLCVSRCTACLAVERLSLPPKITKQNPIRPFWLWCWP